MHTFNVKCTHLMLNVTFKRYINHFKVRKELPRITSPPILPPNTFRYSQTMRPNEAFSECMKVNKEDKECLLLQRVGSAGSLREELTPKKQ